MKVKEQKFIPALRYGFATGMYDLVMKLFFPEKEFKEAVLRHAGLKEGHAVLDFGCGTGTLAMMALSRYPGLSITGVDVDEKILSLAGKKTRERGMDIRLDTYDGKTLPYADASFDCVMTSLVYHHIPVDSRAGVLAEIRRVMKEGAVLVIADVGVPRSRYARFFARIIRRFEPVGDNVAGKIPVQMRMAGFSDSEECWWRNTLMGTLCVYKGVKR